MGNIDFQNGFICGMATKGLTRSGQLYRPNVWNDEGVYSHFYVDFKRTMMPFSLGMWTLSMVVHDSEQLEVTQVDYVSPGVYRIWCDLFGRIHGITVLNKITSFLSFGNGYALPAFSVHFYVAGIIPYENLDYVYDTAPFPAISAQTAESYDIELSVGAIGLSDVYEAVHFPPIAATVSENIHAIVLTQGGS